MLRCVRLVPLAVALASVALPVRAGPSGPVERVIDARTLVVAGEAVRLFGIVVPGLDQACEAGGKPYPCGRIARTGLMDLVAGTEVECVPASGGGSAPIDRVTRAAAAGAACGAAPSRHPPGAVRRPDGC